MKIALCLYGVVGNSKTKSGEQKSSDDILTLGYQKYKSSLFDLHDVDVYIHSWSKEFEDDILRLYSPISYLIEEQEMLTIPDYVRGDSQSQPNRRFNHYSRWRSTQKVLELKRQANKNYDFVLVSRFDWGFENPINFSNLNKSKIYFSNWHGVSYDSVWDIFQDGRGPYYEMAKRHDLSNLPRVGRGYPFDGEGLLDGWFVGGDKTAQIFESLFSNLNQYLMPGNCPQAPLVSNHKLALYHLKMNKMLDHLEFITDPVIDHCVLRYKYFSAKL